MTDNYSKIADSISSFSWNPKKEPFGRAKQKQVAQVSKRFSDDQTDEKCILFVEPKEKTVKQWRKKIASQRVKLLQVEIKKEEKVLNNIEISLAISDL